ncbi:hypothetical protein GCM10011609_65420 [Lentzea pudingi]|uniref:ParB-like N-terminal domain-containing protein n=1 Tax=Lentzea pudingi TaxID=1789439 RepID=A0ABQ2IKL2_9PSEU|nr:ParB/RepB/Spo0J family partition protein [Lentzea pudingi]GGN15709.1 hypothetical protein GCM10011609_65420 [Lentzea pudingi]
MAPFASAEANERLGDLVESGKPVRDLQPADRPDRLAGFGLLLGETAPEPVPVWLLQPADSPRVAGESAEHARLLAEVETSLPPIVVHRSSMRVIDGMHRLQAARIRGDDVISVLFFEGPDVDAFVLAVELNQAHGLPLSRADRRAAAHRMISSRPEWSDRRIAAATGLAAATVRSIRSRSTAQTSQLNARVGKDGRIRPDDGDEGRRKASEFITQNPTASLRTIARAAGISPATVKDVRARLARGEAPEVQPRKAAIPGAVPSSTVETIELLTRLKRDPSLRFAEHGRALIRSLDCCPLNTKQLDELLQAVPPHQRDTLVRLARECASAWQTFADRLTHEPGSKTWSA